MTHNPIRPAKLLEELRDIILSAPEAEDEDDMAVELFGRLLLVDRLVGDTRTRDKLTAELAKAEEQGRQDSVASMKRVLGLA